MNDLSYTAKVFKTVWVSDVHLGTKGSRAKEFLEFLKIIECEKIFLVGDIVDGWQLSKRWYWPQEHNDVMAKILEKSELLNKKIRDSNLPEDIRIGAIVRKDKVIIPRSDFVFQKDDSVVFIAKNDSIPIVENIFRLS